MSSLEIANLLYVDQPVGVGFSTADNYDHANDNLGEYMIQLLLELYRMHPTYKNSEL